MNKAKTSILALLLLITACTSSPAALPQGPDAVWNLVVIGDSSLWGLADAYAAQIEKDVGVQVKVSDFALPSLSAGAVLDVLETGKSSNAHLEKLPEALKEAQVVVMFVNPNDSVVLDHLLDLNGCFDYTPPSSCGPETFMQWTADLEAIWAKIFELRKGKATILRAVDLYNPLVSPWNEHGVFEACTTCWENMSEGARLAAETYGIPFLSRLDAFDGADHTEDPREKGYIVEDGEHPSELAAAYTAELLAEMGYEPVSPP
jgi:hypothetical protein